jgi:zeta-carotene desaturase
MTRSSPDVIVVGAGVAGLAAATALAADGARVLVFEARGVLGGRASSFADVETGTVIDNGQHVVLGCYRETFGFLDRVSARDAIAVQDSLVVPVILRDRRRSELRCPAWPSPWHLLGGVMRWDALGWRDRFAAVRLAPQLLRARRLAQDGTAADRSLDNETVRQWLNRHGQTPRLCELLWEPLAVAALNQHIDSASAAPFFRVLGGVFGPDPRDAAIGLPVPPLSDVFGEPARRYLEQRGCCIHLHAPARIILERDRAVGVLVRGERTLSGSVIAAVPWWAWRTLVDDVAARLAGLEGFRDRAAARRSCPIVTVNIWTERPVLDSAFVGLPGRVFQWVFEKRVESVKVRAQAHLSFVSSGAESIAREDSTTLIERAWRELIEAIPAARVTTVAHASVVRERHATFSLAPGEPPRPAPESGVSGLWLAGDWTDTGLPATIEGAALSGHRVAAALAARAQPQELAT